MLPHQILQIVALFSKNVRVIAFKIFLIPVNRHSPLRNKNSICIKKHYAIVFNFINFTDLDREEFLYIIVRFVFKL